MRTERRQIPQADNKYRAAQRVHPETAAKKETIFFFQMCCKAHAHRHTLSLKEQQNLSREQNHSNQYWALPTTQSDNIMNSGSLRRDTELASNLGIPQGCSKF